MPLEAVTLVLLPGMDGSGELFGPLIGALGPEVPVVVLRYPGDRALGYAGLSAIASEALPKGPYVLLGESFSGPVATMLAAEVHPDLKGLVLCCSFVRNPRPALAPMHWLLRALPMRWTPLKLLGRVLMGRWSTPALQDRLTAAMALLSPLAMRARLHAVLAADATAALAASRVPLLYLQASADLVVPPTAAAMVRAIRPDTRLVRIEGPHFLLQAKPEEAAKAIKTFLVELG